MNPSRTSRQGSALLVTILVVGLLLVLVLSFSIYVRAQLRQVQNRIELMQARKQAELALDMAIGDLQVEAGPDRRITASAGILGNGAAAPEARFWTGVWTQNGAGDVNANPVWLVSGVGATPGTGAGPDSVALLTAVNGDPEVRAPLEAARNPNNNVIGEFAYWVSDEASKASMQARRQAIRLYQTSTLEARRPHTEFQSDFGVNLDPFFQGVDVRPDDADLARELDRLHLPEDILLAQDSANRRFEPLATDLAIHDITPLARGVLENARDGGLKRNLSDLTYRDSFLATDQTATFLGPKGPALLAEWGDLSVADGEPWFSPRPVLSEAVLYVGLFHTWSDAKIRIRFHVQAEFLNPYTLPLSFPVDRDSRYNRAVALVFEGLPEVTVRDLSGTAPALTDDLDDFMYVGSTDYRNYINSWFEIDPFNGSSGPTLQPGEVYQVMEPNPATQPRGLARDFTTTRWSGNAGTKPANDANIEIRARHPSSGVSVYAVPYVHSTADYRRRPVVTAVSNVNFDDFTVTKRFNSGPNPFSRGTSSSYVVDDYNFAYHFRFWSDETDTTAMRDLMTGTHLLDPEFDASGSFVDLTGATRPNADVLIPISTYPPDIVQDTLNLFSGLDNFSDRTARNHREDFRPHFLIDVPNNDTLSVGRLSSLPIRGRRPRMIGSPWGEDYNAAFDRYYFSPKVEDPDSGDTLSGNPALQILEESNPLPASDDAANEMILGAFNLHSTSVEAWEAVLAAPILTPPGEDEGASGDQTRSGAFFRLPGLQADGHRFYTQTANLENADYAFAQGVRTLNATEGRDQIRAIATGIVEALQARGRPFPDLAAFVNSGILQQAIDQTGSSATPINDGLFEYSNVYLTQNDLLTKIASSIVPRSDTFRIRTYGSTLDRAGNTVAQARLEAVVQRFPRKLDESDPMPPATDLLNSREYRIVSTRWLTDEER